MSAIFDAKQSEESANGAITAWTERVKQSGLKCFASFLTTLANRLDEINYFLPRWTRRQLMKLRCLVGDRTAAIRQLEDVVDFIAPFIERLGVKFSLWRPIKRRLAAIFFSLK
ncbi:MAG: hypothetical protein ACREBD_29320 [Blastocatellia bacterium]